MLHRARKLRYRRMWRMRRHQVVAIGEHTDRHFFRRFNNLFRVRRFVAVWILLAVLLISCGLAQIYSLSNYYKTLQPAGGGVYAEGVIGTFTNANPIYATTVADRAVAKLVFSGLLTTNDKNQLTTDLAQSWTADARGQVYTVKLRPGLKWHDGQPVTSEDVVFTYKVIQNPDAQSPLNSSWQNVKVQAVDASTVTFTLINPLSSFPYSLTNGIIPKHILGNTPMADMRTSSFNSAQPVGTGPFFWQDVAVLGNAADTRQELVTLAANLEYHLGRPKLDNFVIHTFRNADDMTDSYAKHELQAMVGLGQEPSNAHEEVHTYSFPQTAAVMSFFKTTSPPLNDKSVRQALVKAVNTKVVRAQLGYPVTAVDEPLLKSQFAYDSSLKQLDYDKPAAEALLANAGWVGDGFRKKAGTPLAFTITAEDTPENTRIAKNLQQQWRSVGVDVKLSLQSASELQISLASHDYEVLLRGISLGIDPDAFVYWHSSQADILAKGRLNFSEYKSNITDEALESGRTRTDTSLRAAKYKPFLGAWREDAPALGLYQTRFLYVTRQPVYGLESHPVNSASDHLSNVHEWMIRRIKTAQ